MGSFVYATDDPTFSDFSYASIINIEGIMQVAISTSGKSPIMARRIRIKVERIFHRIIKKIGYRKYEVAGVCAYCCKRPKLKTVEERKEFLYSLIQDNRIQNLIKENRVEDAKTATLELLHKWEK